MKLSPHFTLAEMTASAKARSLGLDNLPPPELMPRLVLHFTRSPSRSVTFSGRLKRYLPLPCDTITMLFIMISSLIS